MTASLFVKGILIGLLFSILIGAVGVLTVRRAFRFLIKYVVYIMLLCTFLFTFSACKSSQREYNSDRKEEDDTFISIKSDKESEEARQLVSEEKIRIKDEERKNTEQRKEEKMKIQIGDAIFIASLVDNSSVDALKELMRDGPLTLHMSDYAGIEKGADLGVSLPENNMQMNTQAGDIILYQGRMLVIYYDKNAWSLTPIGNIDSVNAKELKAALETGDVIVTLTIE